MPDDSSPPFGDVTKLPFPLAATGDLPPDLLAAFNGAVYLATLADTVQRFCSWQHCDNPRLSALAAADANLVRAEVQNINAQWNNARAAILAVTNELTSVRDEPARFGCIVAPNAHLAALNFAGQVEAAVNSAADPLGYSKCFLDPEARTNPAAVVDNFSAVCAKVREMDWPDGKLIVAAVQMEASKAGQRRATGSGVNGARERLHFDPQTQTVTLDGAHYKVPDPKAFAIYNEIANACPKPLTKGQIQGRIPGCRGVKTIPQLLARLPGPLKDTVRSGVNGYWLDLAPKQKRGKKGHA
jgi:hypothetical protein